MHAEHEIDHDHGVWTGIEIERPPAYIKQHYAPREPEVHPFDIHPEHEAHHALDHHYDDQPAGLRHERVVHDVSIVPLSPEIMTPIDLTERHAVHHHHHEAAVPLHESAPHADRPSHLDEH